MEKKERLFYEYGPIGYEFSLFKENQKRNFKDFIEKTKFAKTRKLEVLPYIWKGHTSILMRKLTGVDMELQKNKVINLKIAGRKMDGTIVQPGEIFSFWNVVGRITKSKGYQEGMIIFNDSLERGMGGGLSQLSNMIHYMVLHTPLEVIELHHHKDVLFPDSGRRVPFGTGTTVVYKNLDYRFKNTTPYPVQIRIWFDNTMIYGEIRSTVPLEEKYKLIEENQYYSKEGEKFFRNSEVYRVVTDKKTKEVLKEEMILKNHAKVLFDPTLIPKEEILEEMK